MIGRWDNLGHTRMWVCLTVCPRNKVCDGAETEALVSGQMLFWLEYSSNLFLFCLFLLFWSPIYAKWTDLTMLIPNYSNSVRWLCLPVHAWAHQAVSVNVLCWLARVSCIPWGPWVSRPYSAQLIPHRRRKRENAWLRLISEEWLGKTWSLLLEPGGFEQWRERIWSRWMCIPSMAPPRTSCDIEQGPELCFHL